MLKPANSAKKKSALLSASAPPPPPPPDPPKKESTERSRADLRKIYVNAKRIYREEEAMLALCKNCIESIRARKAVVDRLRQETEAEMIASAGRLDENIRRVRRVLDTITEMYITDSTEAAERLGKLIDIDIDADEKLEDIRKRLALLEYHRREQEPLLRRAYLYVCAIIQWLTIKAKMFVQVCHHIIESACRMERAPLLTATTESLEFPLATTVSSEPVVSMGKSDETDVTLRSERKRASSEFVVQK